MKFLLDTSTISSAMWKVPDAGVMEKLREHGRECAMASVTWHELKYGVGRLAKGRRRSGLDAFLEEVVRATIPTLPYDERAAEWHAAERVRLEKAGKPVPFSDGQIAAVAATHAFTVVTANMGDFRPFKGIKVISWHTA